MESGSGDFTPISKDTSTSRIYIAMHSSIAVLIPVFLLVSSTAATATSPEQEPGITITIDKDIVIPAESLLISGVVPGVESGDKPVLRIYNPNGELVRIDPLDVDNEGNYSYEWMSGGPLANLVGTYRIVVSYGIMGAERSFLFTSYRQPSCQDLSGIDWPVAFRYPLKEGNSTYFVRYVPINSNLTNMRVDPAINSLIVTTSSLNAACIFLLLPLEVIEAENRNFTISVNDHPAVFKEHESGGGIRALNITLEQGLNSIVITGTRVVPEFSAVGAVSFGVAAAVVLVARWITAMRSSFSCN
jgi:hypothetical protein